MREFVISMIWSNPVVPVSRERRLADRSVPRLIRLWWRAYKKNPGDPAAPGA